MLHRLDHAGLDLRTRVAAQLLQGGVTAHGPAVRSICGHRAVGVAAEDDSGGHRDLLAGEAIRVSGSVPALVARADDLAHPGEPATDAVEEGLTLDRVRLIRSNSSSVSF